MLDLGLALLSSTQPAGCFEAAAHTQNIHSHNHNTTMADSLYNGCPIRSRLYEDSGANSAQQREAMATFIFFSPDFTMSVEAPKAKVTTWKSVAKVNITHRTAYGRRMVAFHGDDEYSDRK
jgi:hypothetical protein